MTLAGGSGGGDTIPPGSGGGGVTDHGQLTGLADDDHTQYDRRLEFFQGIPALVWTINHTFTGLPTVTVINPAGEVVLASVTYPSASQVVVTHAASQAGRAWLYG